MKTPLSPFALLSILLAISIAAVAGALFLGPAQINAAEVFAALVSDQGATSAIVREIRLPRVLAAWVAGACLGLAGAGLQGLLRNPLADPFVIGASSGAALGATLAISSGLQASFLGIGAVSWLAFGGTLAASS